MTLGRKFMAASSRVRPACVCTKVLRSRILAATLVCVRPKSQPYRRTAFLVSGGVVTGCIGYVVSRTGILVKKREHHCIERADDRKITARTTGSS
jgi:hypothetical protein